MRIPQNKKTEFNSRHEVVGVSVPRLDSWQKVTGEAKYGADIYLPRMLHGRILRSKHAHARIVRINTEKAERLQGVKGVVTWKDAPDVLIGMYQNDRRLFAKEKVRYMGDAIAAVAATDQDIADEALTLIEVEYEELSAVFDPFEAMSPGAPLIHDEFPKNIGARRRIRKGDPKKIFNEAKFVFEDTFKTQMVEHSQIEPHAAVAECDLSGKVTIWSNSQAPFNNRVLLAKALQMPMSKLRIITTNIGGAFGGKQDMMAEPACILLARKTGRPVKIVIDRTEEFTASTVRHPFIMTYKTAVTREGKILARQINLVQDFGAYSDIGEGVLRYATLMASGPYRVENIWIDAVAVYTNQHVGSTMRGVGVPQVCFAGESQIDRIAHEIGVDPYHIRMINALRDGDTTANAQKLRIIGYQQTLSKAKEESGYRWRTTKINHGFGIASMIYACGAAGRHDYSSAIVRLNEDGTVVVSIGAPDVGQGCRTVLAQIAAQELGVRYEDVLLDLPDTDRSPVDLYGANATRITYVTGNAVKAAAAEAKEQILMGASEKWGIPKQDILIVQGEVFKMGDTDPLGPLQGLIAEMHRPIGRTIIGHGSYHTNGFEMDLETGQANVVDFFIFGTHIAEVEVDPETGSVKVLNIWAAHDVGRAINPSNVEGQIEGGVQMGLGFGLMEEIVRKNGDTLNPSFLDYKIPIAPDMPNIKPIIVEVPEPLGPFGARGIGEATTIPTAAAIANAVFNATGVQFKELPLTPERVLEGLKSKKLTLQLQTSETSPYFSRQVLSRMKLSGSN
jgi:CO/xanthine dehydrogenase Mo-binding subunit